MSESGKLSDAQIARILGLRETGLSASAIAKHFGISKNTVLYHCKRNNIVRVQAGKAP